MSHESAVGRRSPTGGYSLVEVLLAALIMVVGILGVLAVFPQAHGVAKASGRTSVLNHLASEQLERLRSLDYGHADLASGIHPAVQTDSNGDRYYPASGFGEEYSVRWRVLTGPTNSSGTPEPKMKRIVVEATYMTRYAGDATPLPTARSIEVSSRTYLAE